MDLPTLMLRRYRTSSSCLPNFKHRAYCDRPHLRQCSWVTSYLCLSNCSFTHLPFGATIWPVAFHCNLKTEAPQFRMYCVSDTRSVEGEGIVRHVLGFAGTSFAVIRDSASYVFRSMPYSRQPLRGHFGFAGHPLPRPWVEWMGVSIEMVSPLGTKLALI